MLHVAVSLALLLTALYAVFWWRRRHLWIYGEQFPGPRWLPFLGTIHIFSTDTTRQFRILLKMFEEYGSTVRFWGGPALLFFMSKDPEIVKQVLIHPRVMSHDTFSTKAMSSLGSHGLLVLNGEEWKTQRKMVNPVFNPLMLQEYVKTIAQKAGVLAQVLAEVSDGRTFDVYPYLGLCTFEQISDTVIGVERSVQTSGDDAYLTYMHHANQFVARRFLFPFLLVDWIYYKTSLGRTHQKVFGKLRGFSADAVTQKLTSGVRRVGVATSSNKTLNSLLDMALAATPPLPAEQLTDHVTSILTAGTETSATSMAFFLVLVAIHADVQEQIYEEVRELAAEDVNRMPTLERAIKETLRLFPPIMFSPRLIPEDMLLSNGKTLPKGSSFIVHYYAMQRDEALFKDANRFWPDRWLPENRSDDYHLFSYLPFGAGSRVCIGQKYAMLQLKVTLSEVIRKFHVTTGMSERDLTSNLKVGVSLQMDKSVQGYGVQMRKRDAPS